MIDQLITYFTALPAPATSPLGVALNTAGMLTQLGQAASVNILDTRDTAGNPPYVRLYDSGEVGNKQTFLAGANRAYAETLSMLVECAAYGPTVSSASARADYLRIAAEGKMQTLFGTIRGGALTPRTDLGGTTSADSVQRLWIEGSRKSPTPTGPGEYVDNPQWTVVRVFEVFMTVLRYRAP